MQEKKVRRIIDRLHNLQEDYSMDSSQIMKLVVLARAGLIDPEDVNQVRIAIKTMQDGNVPTLVQRNVLFGMLGALADLITSDMALFMKIKQDVNKNQEDDHYQRKDDVDNGGDTSI